MGLLSHDNYCLVGTDTYLKLMICHNKTKESISLKKSLGVQ